jgi:hypothetical protein
MTRLSFFLFIHSCRRITLEPTFKDLEGYFIVRCYGDWEEGCDEWYSVSCESDGTLKIWLAENRLLLLPFFSLVKSKRSQLQINRGY